MPYEPAPETNESKDEGEGTPGKNMAHIVDQAKPLFFFNIKKSSKVVSAARTPSFENTPRSSLRESLKEDERVP